MSNRSHELLKEFISQYQKGEAPQIPEFLRRAGDGQQELFDGIEEFLEAAPSVDLTEGAKERHSERMTALFREAFGVEYDAKTVEDRAKVAAAGSAKESWVARTRESVRRASERGKSAYESAMGSVAISIAPLREAEATGRGSAAGLVGATTPVAHFNLPGVGRGSLRVEDGSLTAEIRVLKETLKDESFILLLPTAGNPEMSDPDFDIAWNEGIPGVVILEGDGDTKTGVAGGAKGSTPDLDGLAVGAELYLDHESKEAADPNRKI